MDISMVPISILSVKGSEKKTIPRIMAKRILEAEMRDPGAASMYLYPMVMKTCPRREKNPTPKQRNNFV